MGGITGKLHGHNGFQTYPKGVTISRYCISETGNRPRQRYFFYRFGNWTKARDTINYEALDRAYAAHGGEAAFYHQAHDQLIAELAARPERW